MDGALASEIRDRTSSLKETNGVAESSRLASKINKKESKEGERERDRSEESLASYTGNLFELVAKNLST